MLVLAGHGGGPTGNFGRDTNTGVSFYKNFLIDDIKIYFLTKIAIWTFLKCFICKGNF